VEQATRHQLESADGSFLYPYVTAGKKMRVNNSSDIAVANKASSQQMESVTDASLLYSYLTAGNERADSCSHAVENRHLVEKRKVFFTFLCAISTTQRANSFSTAFLLQAISVGEMESLTDVFVVEFYVRLAMRGPTY
jgi:hypothetical protein